MRTTTSIEASLPESLRPVFSEQVRALRSFLAERPNEAPDRLLRGAMSQVLEKSFSLPTPLARALARLASELPGPAGASQDETVLMRCALQRALVAGGLASEARPYYIVAARAAAEALELSEDMIVVADPAQRRANIPSLPPLHHQDSTIEEGAQSRFFRQHWTAE